MLNYELSGRPGSALLLLRLAALLLICCCGCGEKYEGYALGNVHLDLSSEEVMDLYPANGLAAELKWMKDNDYGQIFCRPEDGSKNREETFVLLDNKVLQFTRREPLDKEQLEKTLSLLRRRFGEPSADVPHFARHNAYLRGIKDQKEQFEELWFWGDEERSQVMSVSSMPDKNEMYFLIYDPSRYNRIEQLVRESNQKRQRMFEEMEKQKQAGTTGGLTPPPAGAEGGGIGGDGAEGGGEGSGEGEAAPPDGT